MFLKIASNNSTFLPPEKEALRRQSSKRKNKIKLPGRKLISFSPDYSYSEYIQRLPEVYKTACLLHWVSTSGQNQTVRLVQRLLNLTANYLERMLYTGHSIWQSRPAPKAIYT